MYIVQMEKECGRFKKSDFQNNLLFIYKDHALMRRGDTARIWLRFSMFWIYL